LLRVAVLSLMPTAYLPAQVFSLWDKARHALAFTALTTLGLLASPPPALARGHRHGPDFFPSKAPVPVSALLCLVVAISDGDTLTARCGTPGAYQQVKVRIAAIDAPERRQAFGQRARQHLAQLCFRQRATLHILYHDAYGRAVANVRCGTTDAASAQVGAGMAWVYTPYASEHPHLVRLQQQARASGRGLWAQPRPQAPWSYRQRHQR